LEPLQDWIRSGLAVRDAWSNVLDSEPITAVFCGDDSNWHTRLPVLLARKRNLPTIDFHHGAFDGRFLLKNLPSDFYLAKSDMERDYLVRVCRLPSDRILVGGTNLGAAKRHRDRIGSNIVFFSEPYDSIGGRPEEVYRELLPLLSSLASEQGRTLVVKLHPFESPRERRKLVQTVLGPKQASTVKIVSGPLSDELLPTAWFGITVESTTVLDCTQQGVPCFQCEWLVSTPFAYVQQFDRFGVGRLLHSPAEIADIPRILEHWAHRAPAVEEPLAVDVLRQVFAGSRAPVQSNS